VKPGTGTDTTTVTEGNPSMNEQVFVASVYYRDPKGALDWLEKAFGFEVTMAIDGTDDDPTMCHYEMSHEGRGRIMIGGEWADWIKSPASVEGVNTQGLHVELLSDLDQHCERARSTGAVIAAEPEDQFYGDRTYRALDAEGHAWTFSMHVRDVALAEAEQALGRKIEATSWT
jgi:uncharacterized glyoxalase superfamily protein PhnB